MNKKIVIMIGPLPPPIGGVSIHLSRLVSMLEDSYDIKIIDSSKRRVTQVIEFAKVLVKSKINSSRLIIHNHIYRIKFCAVLALLSRLFKFDYVQTIHSFRVNVQELKKSDVLLINLWVQNTKKFIVVNRSIYDELVKLNRSILPKLLVLPAFIPYNSVVSENEKGYYLEQLQITKFANSHNILLCANAYKIVFYNNEDLYGVDLCIELMKKLVSLKQNHVGFVFMLPQIGDSEYFSEMKRRIIEYRLEKDFHFVNKDVDLVPLFEHIDIFLRPTNTDGDALSIREALYAGIPTIASDVVERPLGTILFKNRDVTDLFEKTLNLIGNLKEEKAKVQKYRLDQAGFLEQYFSVYEWN